MTIIYIFDYLCYIILAPNVLESMGLIDVIVQPLKVQLATTNTAIVQQAYLI